MPVTGGYVYRGESSSPYYGRYFFADYCSDRIWTLHNEKGEWIKEDFGQFQDNNFSTFGEDYKGELYIAGLSSGAIYRFTGQLTGLPASERSFDIKLFQGQTFNHRIRLEIIHDIPSETSISVYDIRGVLQYRAIADGSTYEVDLVGIPPVYHQEYLLHRFFYQIFVCRSHQLI
jgi:hypothetical protein